jgi:hypothetical protein
MLRAPGLLTTFGNQGFYLGEPEEVQAAYADVRIAFIKKFGKHRVTSGTRGVPKIWLPNSSPARVALGAQSSPSTNAPPVRIGLFIGVDGVTYSCDGSRFDLYREYRDRESMTNVSTSELARVVSRLTEAGLLNEKSRGLGGTITIPAQTLEIRIQWPGREFHCTWFWRPGSQVPGKYLDILDDVPASWKTEFLRKFVDANRKLDVEYKAHKSQYSDGFGL